MGILSQQRHEKRPTWQRALEVLRTWLKENLVFVIQDVIAFSQRFGVKEASKILSRKSNKPINLPVEGIDQDVLVRPRSSDLSVFREIFIEEHYAVDLGFTPQTIVDVGANIGLASLYFHRKYPKADIVALEPHPGNAELLKKNIHGKGNKITVIEGGLSSKEGTNIVIENPGAQHWGYRGVDSPHGKIRGFTIPGLITECGLDTIDLLKMDIEGAEFEIFKGNIDWLDKVRGIIIEIHEKVNPGSTKYIIEQLENKGYVLNKNGHEMVFIKA